MIKGSLHQEDIIPNVYALTNNFKIHKVKTERIKRKIDNYSWKLTLVFSN